MEEINQNQGSYANNQQYLSQTALELRLATDTILEKIFTFLSAESTITTQGENGKVNIKKIKLGTPLMNKEGISHMTNYISAIINPAVVQGNYSEDWYREQIEITHKNLAYLITVNTPYWDININSRISIISFIMELVKPFLSRLIDNKERESYMATIRTTESNTNTMKGSGLFNKVGIQ